MINEVNYDGIKATIYTKSYFMGDIVKTEVKLFKTFKSNYAQHENVDFYQYIVKSKRTKQEDNVGGYKPFLLIVKGWDKPNPDDPTEILSKDENATVSKYKYKSFDDRYVSDFMNNIVPSIKNEDIILLTN